jgi:hypothetical protein
MRCVDGSLSLRRDSTKRRVVLPDGAQLVRLDPSADQRMRRNYRQREESLRLASPDGVREMMFWGAQYVEQMEERGELRILEQYKR